MSNARTLADNWAADITGVTAGTGLTGGGTSGAVTLSLNTSGVTAATYTVATVTVDSYGRITSASSGTGESFHPFLLMGA